jgi:single-strand DNA-binding protein
MAKATLVIEGFISNDLEYRDAGAHRVVAVTVPVTPQKQVDGKWEDSGETVWYESSFWNEHADVVTQLVEKGTLVTITGTPELDVFTKRDGTPGAKIKLGNPTIAKVARRPKRGQENRGGTVGATTGEPWAMTPPASPEATGDVWNTPGGYSDETPF